MSELQQEDNYDLDDEDVSLEEEVIETEDLDADQDAESAPEKVKFSVEQQSVVDEIINKKTFKSHEKERKSQRENEELQRQLSELQAKLPEQGRPEVPNIPDPFALSDEEYRRSQANRDDAIRNAIAYDQQQKAISQQQSNLKYQQELQQHEALNERVESYSQTAKKLGIKPEELQVAGNVVAQFGMNDDVVQFILDDEQGPLITTYLSKNPIELEELSNLSPAKAAVRIATLIRQKAIALKPKVNGAPDPLESPHSPGKAPKPKGPSGATFE
jgi:hypothetical protein